MKTAVASRQARPSRTDKNGRLSHAGKKIWRSRYLYLLLLPTFVWYIVFMYAPLYGAQIAFRDFMPALGITGGKWVGFKYFIQFFKSEYFVRLMKNTLGISVYSIVVGFPIPVILALLMNEVRSKYFKKGVQTIVYMPHFISAVVVVSLINAMLSPSNGLFNQIIQMFGGDPVHFMAEPKYFKTVYVLSDIWQTAGYGSIVYLAALTSIDPSLYEAATVDGASKWKKLLHITLGITGGKWVGFKYFIQFFKSEYFVRLMKNTLGISVYSIVVGFPIPVILALLMNEVRSKYFKKGVQTIVYMPHFISAVVVVSLINAMLSPSNGLFNQIIQMFGGDPVHFMAEPKYFKTVYVLSDIWQTAGYGSIVYLAALTSIDPSLYEAATVDGASKWKKLLHITLPCILPTIMTMLILRMGSIFTVGYEKIMLMYNPATYETADVISTYVYRRAFEGGEYSFSAAVGLFNSVINFIVIIVFNKISKRVSEVSLW